jgi:hypothetical protein
MIKSTTTTTDPETSKFLAGVAARVARATDGKAQPSITTPPTDGMATSTPAATSGVPSTTTAAPMAASNVRKSPADLARGKWSTSGLSAAHADTLKLAGISAAESAALGAPAAAALRIQYFDTEGKPSQFYRLRFLEDLPGFRGMVEKPQRFWQPPRSLNEVYLPPLLDKPWKDVLQDAAIPVVIVEGELKSAAGCAAGIPTLGLGGVDVYKSTKRGLDLLPVLADAKWSDRKVTIAFDSDVATNPNVLAAQNRLARSLTNLGAEPTIATIPPGVDGRKQGLDDLLVAAAASGESPSAVLKNLTDAAKPYPEAVALHEMNEKVVLVRNPPAIVERETSRVMKKDTFTGHTYAPSKHVEMAGARGARKEVSTASRWMEWPGRFEVEEITYSPGHGSIEHRGGKRYWNNWTGWGCEPVEGDVSRWHALLDHVFTSDPGSRKWFEQWCAYPLQNPGVKMYTAVIFHGPKHGWGKSFVGELLQKVYGERNTVTLTAKNLDEAFNSLLANKQFVSGEEITGNNRKDLADLLKSMITSETRNVNEKYVPQYVLPAIENYFFTSNHADAFLLADEDRRYFVHRVDSPTTPPKEWWLDLREWKRGTGPSALFHYLLNVDLTGFDPFGRAPKTQAKLAMIDRSKNDLQLWVALLAEGGSAAEEALGALLIGQEGRDIFTVADLCRAFDPEGRFKFFTPEKVGRALSDAGFPRERFRAANVVSRYYAVRNRGDWEGRNPADWCQHVEKHAVRSKF